MFYMDVTAQSPQRIVTQTAADTLSRLSIMFNNQESPSVLLEKAGVYRKRALLTTLIGGTVGGFLVYEGFSNPTDNSTSSTNPLAYIGIGVCTVSAIAAFIYDYMSADYTKKAGEQLRRITISLGGISYRF